MVTSVVSASTRRAWPRVREKGKGRWRRKKKRSYLISCASNAMKRDILQMVAPTKKSSSWIEEGRREAKEYKMLQVPHMGSPYLYVPYQASGEATRRASTKATSWARKDTLRANQYQSWRWWWLKEEDEKKQEGVKEQGTQCKIKMPR